MKAAEYQAVETLGFAQPPPKPCTARRNIVPLQPQSWAELSRSLTEKSNSAPSVPSMPDRIEQLDLNPAEQVSAQPTTADSTAS